MVKIIFAHVSEDPKKINYFVKSTTFLGVVVDNQFFYSIPFYFAIWNIFIQSLLTGGRGLHIIKWENPGIQNCGAHTLSLILLYTNLEPNFMEPGFMSSLDGCK